MTKPYKLAVKAVIFDEQNRCLLIRRSKACRNFTGQWEWPGGKVDEGEDFASAVIREAREEIGLDIEIARLAGATEFEMPTVRVVLLCMEARVRGGAVRLSEEHDDFAWVHLGRLGELEITTHMRDFMLEYARKREVRT